jgi:glycosyltransferase involved in cell wall biosynthesis
VSSAAPALAAQSSGAAHIGSLSVFFPCYNDAPTISGLVRSTADTLSAAGIAHEIIVVNDGSSDDSLAILHDLAHEIDVLTIVDHGHNRGYGAALRSGFAAARGDWVFYTDGDGQYDPTEVERLIALVSEDVDVVQGWKLDRNDSALRALVGRAYHHAVRVLFRLPVRDTDCDFRLIRRAALARVTLRHSSGVICVEMLRKLDRAGARFTEIGVHHHARPFGRSEFFRFRRVAQSLVDVAWLWVNLVLLRRRDA